MKLTPLQFLEQYLFLTVFLIPVLLLLVGSLGKKLARGRGWRRSDFLLGPDLTLAALSGGLVNLLDIAKDSSDMMAPRIILTTLFIVCCFCIFIVVLAWQQESFQQQLKADLRALGEGRKHPQAVREAG